MKSTTTRLLYCLPLLLLVFAAPVAAESVRDVERVSRITEHNLDSATRGYHCDQFEAHHATSPTLVSAVDDAHRVGQHVLFCSSFTKPLTEERPTGAGIIVFVNDQGVVRHPVW